LQLPPGRSIRTPQQLRGLTSIELKTMGVKANMRLDQKTIDQVLAAVRRGKIPNRDGSYNKTPSPESGQSKLQRMVQDLQKLAQRSDGGLVGSWP
jgi:hypothetical protein